MSSVEQRPGAGLTILTGLAAALTAYTAVLPTHDVMAAETAGTQSARAAQITFTIPAQTLPGALTAFGDQAGLQVTVDSALLNGLSAPAVSGKMSAEEALRRLLAGTGLVWRFSDATTVVLEKVAADGAMTLDPVTIEGRSSVAASVEQTALTPIRGYVATHAVTGTKTDTPIAETPQSISVIPKDQIEEQSAQTLNQVLRYTSGVTPETRGAVATRYDLLTIRGFDSNSYLNGLQLSSLYYLSAQVDPYLLERVEVLKGPSSVLFGQASAGGLINQVSKHPTDTAYHEVGMEVGTDNHFRSSMDFSGPMDNQGKFLYRFTATGLTEDGQIDTTENERVAVAPAFTWKPDDDTRLSVLGFYQNDPKGNSYGAVPPSGTVVYNPYGTLSSDFYDGDPNFEKFARRQESLGYEFDKRLSDTWSVRMNARAMRSTLAYDSVYASTLSSDNRTLTRGTASSRETMNSYTTDNQVEARVDTGILKHTLLAGVDYRYTTGHYAVGFGTAPSIDLFAPVYYQTITAPDLNRTDIDSDQVGLYMQDQIRLGGFILTLGGRHDRATQTSETSSGTTKTDDSAWTNKIGLTYVFDNGFAPYAGYSESFTPVAMTDYSGNPFKPEEGTQHEIGVKYQPPGTESLFTAAVFNLVRSNVTTSDSAHTGYYVQLGEARSRGLELEAKTALSEQWDLVGAYTYLDTKVTRDNSGQQGNRLGAVPRHQASLWAMYHVPSGTELTGLSIGGGVRYTGSTSDPDNTLDVPEYTLFDAAASYDLGVLSSRLDGAELSLNVKNVFDKHYVASCYYASWCAYGYDRTVTAALRYRW